MGRGAQPTSRLLSGRRRFAVWAVAVVLLVTVAPAATFLANRAANPGPASAGTSSAVFDPGQPYRATLRFSLPAPIDDEIAAAVRQGGASPVMVEVVAPAGDGRYWVVDHPAETRPNARGRLLDTEGSEISEFVFDEQTTLFTPGPGQTLWAVAIDAETGAETVVGRTAGGEEIGRFAVPSGVLSRAIVFGRGGIFVLTEEWASDPQTDETVYAGALHPVAAGGPDYVSVGAESAEAIPGGVFFDTRGALYSIERTPSGGHALSARSASGGQITTVPLPDGFRPYAVDDAGRVYAEAPRVADTEAPVRSTIGDGAGERTTVKVLTEDGVLATLQVPRLATVWGWTSPAWPDANGDLTTWTASAGRIDVLSLRPDSQATRAIADGAAPDEVDLRIVFPEQPLSGDPYEARDAAERDLFQLVYAGLVSHDAGLSPVANIAEAVPSKANGGVSSDGLTISYRLRPGLRWHDGEPLTAEDVAATWRYLRDDPIAGPEPFPGFSAIRDVTAEGLDLTVRLSEPFGAGPETFFPYVLPRHVIERASGLLNAGLVAAPVGSGPFKLTRWESGTRWLLERAGGTASDGAPAAVEVRFASAEDALGAFRSAPAAIWTWADRENANTLSRDGLAATEEAETGRWVGTLLDSSASGLPDLRVRQALAAVYPLEKLRADVYGGDRVVEPFPAVSAAYSGEALSQPMSAEEARGVLRGADVGVTLAHASRNGLPELTPEHPLLVEEAWSAAGVRVARGFATPRFYSSWWFAGSLSAMTRSTSIGVFQGYPDAGWGGVFDPSDDPSPADPWGQGIAGGDDRELASLFARARGEYDSERRAAISRLVTQRVLERALAVFDYYEQRVVARSAAVEGLAPGPYPAGDFWNAASWRIREAR